MVIEMFVADYYDCPMWIYIPTREWFETNGLLGDNGYPRYWNRQEMGYLYGTFQHASEIDSGNAHIVRASGVGQWSLMDNQFIVVSI